MTELITALALPPVGLMTQTLLLPVLVLISIVTEARGAELN